MFAGLGGSTAPPIDLPAEGAVAAAAAAGTPATVQVEAIGCDGVSSGSGVVVQPGFIVTNAHVVAGGEVLNVRDAGGTHDAVAILVDPNLDLAVLSAPTATATPLPWATVPAEPGDQRCDPRLPRRAARAEHPPRRGPQQREGAGP